jgi:UDPglucose 6-dehydrogenase
MLVTVIGTGHIGVTHAVCMAELGHDVLAMDVDEAMIAKVARGEVPFFEPGLEPILRKNLRDGRIRFTTSYREVADFGNVHFLCVGTPQTVGGAADLSYICAALRGLAAHLKSRCLIVGRSTVPVGTARMLLARARDLAPAGERVDLAWNPEFLREGFAVHDSLQPDRLVVGVTCDSATRTLEQVYAKLLQRGVPGLFIDLETAELIKMSANAFLATRISFINAMAEVCDAVGADVTQLVRALAHDERIGGRYLSPGLGFGGSCLPKDIRAFQAKATSLGLGSVVDLLRSVDAINMARRATVMDLATQTLGGSLAGQRVAVLGVAFKPDSDDVRDSPALDICGRLELAGATVSVHDPAAMPNAAQVHPHLRYAQSVSEAVEGADLVMHLTEWPDYQAIDPVALGKVVASRVLIDARCALDMPVWQAASWTVHVLGRQRAAGTALGRQLADPA